MEVRERPLIPEGSHQHSLDHKNAFVIERFDYSNGILAYLKGHSVPYKGMPTEGAVQAINVVKKLLRFQPMAAMWIAIEPHILKTEYQMPITREICNMFPSRLGISIAHVLEYDSAYRLFIQDMFNETTKEALLSNPVKEIWRLVGINKRRAHAVAHKTIKRFAYIFMFLLFLPNIRKAFRNCDFTKFQHDDSDKYWIALRTDYNAKA